jgi:hypothetical protein
MGSEAAIPLLGFFMRCEKSDGHLLLTKHLRNQRRNTHMTRVKR